MNILKSNGLNLAALAMIILSLTLTLTGPLSLNAQENQKNLRQMIKKTISKSKKLKKVLPQQEHINDSLKKKLSDGNEMARDLASFPKDKEKSNDGATTSDKNRPKVESWNYKQEDLIDSDQAKKLLED